MARRRKRTRSNRTRTRGGKGGKVLAKGMQNQGLSVDESNGAKSIREQFHVYYLDYGDTPPPGVDSEWWEDAISRHADWVRNRERELKINSGL